MIDRRQFMFATAASAAALAAAPPPVFAAAKGLADSEIVRRALALHPGLYRYLSPRGWAQRLTLFEREWAAAADTAQRFLSLSRLTAAIRCGHTQCNPFNQSDAVVAQVFDRPTRLPFAFRWIDGRMVVTGDSGAVTGIAKGSVVERLNGMRPADILRALLPYARADGSNDGKRIAQLEMRGDETFETFDIFQGLLFPPPGGTHRLTWRDPAGKRHAAEIPAIGYAARKALHPTRSADGPLWSWSVDGAGIATLTMPDWVTYNTRWDWEAWLTERLASLGGARGLIIDLRGNEGGTDCGTWLLRRMIDRPMRPLRYRSKVRFRTAPEDLVPYLSSWDPGFRSIGVDGIAGPDGLLTLPDSDDDDWNLVPASPRIRVPVAVLMGPINSSATFSFVRRVQELKAATLIGQPSGGNLRGINGGAMFFVRLPESGLEFDLPLKGYFPDVPQPDAPVRPDIAVRESPADIAAGRDPAMAAARRHLLSK